MARFAAPAPPPAPDLAPTLSAPRRVGRGHARHDPLRGLDASNHHDETDHQARPHSRITDRILVELQQGTRPWAKPWSGGDMAASGQIRPLRATGQPDGRGRLPAPRSFAGT
ncbi:ArdC-like ssDNA-binding domain-containing protein [Rhabdaerophilum sp.]|uniref:ArdC-like ssDNA-binding domain-containing protein n=1 Tax=Rhabdaerophilum sp. TaxID=2717341 RepID=UPI0038D474FB